MFRKWCLLLIVLLAIAPAGCAASTTATSTSPPPVYSQYELAYRLLDEYPDFFWCDPYEYPIGRPEQEAADALARFPDIRANAAEFAAILARLELPDKADYSDAEKLSIFREHNKLSGAVQLTASGDIFDFTIRVGEGDGKRIEGAITRAGAVAVTSEAPSINTCPICLTAGTLIATPGGSVPVERLRPGLEVWTYDETGRPIAVKLLVTLSTAVPPSFRAVRVTLADGRSVTASPGHPTAVGHPLGGYRPGEILDGAVVVTVETVLYEGGRTYDLLPAGPTGFYRANGVLLESTLAVK